MDQREIEEAWLRENGIECSAYAGRVSLKLCQFLRTFPTVRVARDHDPRTRHKACDSCTIWKAKEIMDQGTHLNVIQREN